MNAYVEMIYIPQRTCGILATGIYSGYEYLVITYGTHPCAYIRSDNLTEKQINIIDENCHGGITFPQQEFGGNIKNIDGKWVGWDYAHFGDYVGYGDCEGKIYTTEEIINEVKSIIDKL